MRSCQPVAPTGHWGGSFPARESGANFICREGFQGIVIGTAIPGMAGPITETLDDEVELTVSRSQAPPVTGSRWPGR